MKDHPVTAGQVFMVIHAHVAEELSAKADSTASRNVRSRLPRMIRERQYPVSSTCEPQGLPVVRCSPLLPGIMGKRVDN